MVRRSRLHISQQMRLFILARDEHTCQLCREKFPDSELHVHHVVPSPLGTNEPENLITLCVAHHMKIGNKRLFKPGDLSCPFALHEDYFYRKFTLEVQAVKVLEAYWLHLNPHNRPLENSRLVSIRSYLKDLRDFEIARAMEKTIEKLPGAWTEERYRYLFGTLRQMRGNVYQKEVNQ